MEIGFKLPNRANRAQLILIIGTAIFAAGALGFIAGYLSQVQITTIAAMALIFVTTGSSIKKI